MTSRPSRRLYTSLFASTLLIFAEPVCRAQVEIKPIGDVALVNSSPALVSAISNPNVTDIILLHNIQLNNLSGHAPTWVPPHSVVIAGLNPPQIVGNGTFNTTGAAQIDFGNLIPAIELSSGVVIELRDLVLTGIASKRSPAAANPDFLYPVGFELFPSVITKPNVTAVFNNTLFYEYLQSCSETDLQQTAFNWQTIFGGTSASGYRLDPPLIWLSGLHSIPIVVNHANGSQAGIMTVVADGVSIGCIQDPYLSLPKPTQANNTGAAVVDSPNNPSQTTSGGLSAGGIAGIVVASVVAAAALLTGLWLSHQMRLRKRQQCLTPIMPIDKGESNRFESSDTISTSDSPYSISAAMQETQHELGVASALRVRFGGVEGLEIGQLIGLGSHGRIYKASMRGTPCAVKVVEHYVDPQGKKSDEATSEAVFLTALAHPNIVRVYRVATIKLENQSGIYSRGWDEATPGQDPENPDSDKKLQDKSIMSKADETVAEGESSIPCAEAESRHQETSTSMDILPLARSSPGVYETWMVMEFCEKGSLHAAIRRRKFATSKNMPVILGILIDVAEGMEFLHTSAHIIHGDLKPANVLLKTSADGAGLTAVVADFGLSRMLDVDRQQSSIQRTTTQGTVGYMSPELLKEGRLTGKADVWAFGIIMAEIWMGKPTVGDLNSAQILFSLSEGKHPTRPTLTADCPAAYAAVVDGCLEMDVRRRWDFARVLSALKTLRASYLCD